jgi:hypothetical protein
LLVFAQDAAWELTLAVVAEGHLCLAEANGVFSLGDAIELLELGLVDALQRKLGGAATYDIARVFDLLFGALLAWLGKYSSMALIPMLEGREAMFAVVLG